MPQCVDFRADISTIRRETGSRAAEAGITTGSVRDHSLTGSDDDGAERSRAIEATNDLCRKPARNIIGAVNHHDAPSRMRDIRTRAERRMWPAVRLLN